MPSPIIVNNNWRYAYLGLYTIGGVFSVMAIGLLIWIAYCIAIEAEPLAAVAFLPSMPTAIIFVLIIGIMAVSIAAWQLGAKYQQRYEQQFK
jgi:hypothetical protein